MSSTPSTTVREAGSHQPARRRIGRRLSTTHVLIAIVVILAFVLNLLVLQDRGDTTLVAMADEALPAGSTLDSDVLRLVPVDAGFEGLPGLIDESELAGLDGWVLARSIPAGGLLDSSALVEAGSGSGMRAMSLAVPEEHAAGGSLVAGDRVDVIAVVEDEASFIATDLEVVSVASESGSIGEISEFHIVVNVEPEAALDLATALAAGPIEVIRSTGARPVAGDAGDS